MRLLTFSAALAALVAVALATCMSAQFCSSGVLLQQARSYMHLICVPTTSLIHARWDSMQLQRVAADKSAIAAVAVA
jgi:hypothetical protein